MIFDYEDEKKSWDKFPSWLVFLAFFIILCLLITTGYSILYHSVTLKQFLTGLSIGLVFSIGSILYLRVEFSNEDVIKTFGNSLLLTLAMFLISGFIVMMVVIIGPNIAHGLRIEAMKILIFSFQQIATSFLFASAAFLALFSLVRIIIKR